MATTLSSPTEARASTTTIIPTWHLNDDNKVEFPRLALNTAGLTTDDTERAFRNALDAGISHVEFHPGAECDGVARVLQSKNFDRKSIFLTTKVETHWEENPSPEMAAAYVQKQLDATPSPSKPICSRAISAATNLFF